MVTKEQVLAAGARAELPRCEWSRRRWAVAGKMDDITHKRHWANGLLTMREVRVNYTRLVPLDRSRYPGNVLRVIRAEAKNWKGEVRR